MMIREFSSKILNDKTDTEVILKTVVFFPLIFTEEISDWK